MQAWRSCTKAQRGIFIKHVVIRYEFPFLTLLACDSRKDRFREGISLIVFLLLCFFGNLERFLLSALAISPHNKLVTPLGMTCSLPYPCF